MMPGALNLGAATLGGRDGAATIDRIAKTIHHTTKQRLADRHVHDVAGANDGCRLRGDTAVVARKYGTDAVGAEI